MNELEIIKIIKNTLDDSSFIGDDTAFIKDLGIILTQDTLIEDVHFRHSTISHYDLGIKAAAVNLSDIAASGGIAKYLLISLSLQADISENFIKEFYRAINFMCKKYNIKVAGGDITGAEKTAISICAIGISDGITPAKRSNAKFGDIIFTTGVHGSSYAGFLALEKNLAVSKQLIKAHTNPIPQLEIGRKIATHTNYPCLMDSSDGLADALFKIADASKLSAVVDFSDIPYDPEIVTMAQTVGEDFKKWILFGAEDFQLVGTMRSDEYKKLKSQGVEIFKIGRMQDKKEHALYLNFENEIFTFDEKDIKNNCFNHFDEGNSK